MALPKLNATPEYETYVPSTGQKVKFRPYLVKEEKILLLAMESQDQAQALAAIARVIEACVADKLPQLTTFDVEFLFIKIRAKSVGEKSNLVIKCKECNHENPVAYDLDQVEMAVPKFDPIIKLTPTISLKMRWPSYNTITTSKAVLDASSPTQQAFAVVAKCIEAIQTESENILTKDSSDAELMEFLDSMTSDQYKKLIEFVSGMPKLVHEVSCTCEKCFTPNTVKLEGLADFF